MDLFIFALVLLLVVPTVWRTLRGDKLDEAGLLRLRVEMILLDNDARKSGLSLTECDEALTEALANYIESGLLDSQQAKSVENTVRHNRVL